MNFRPDDAAQGATVIFTAKEKLPPQVLIVDDSKDIRELIASVLRKSGYRVLEAADGLAARSILMTEHPALVVSDLEMPVCNGWEVIEYCHTQHPTMPVLIVSGAPWGRRPEIEGWAAGFLPKPFRVDRFRSEIRRLVGLAA